VSYISTCNMLRVRPHRLPWIGRALLTVFNIVWLCAVVPGHTRGIVKLPGVASNTPVVGTTAGSTASCHPSVTAGHCHPKRPDGKPKNDSAHCAVCHLAARLANPPALPPPIAAPQRLAMVMAAEADSLISLPIVLPYDALAPPGAILHVVVG
jgi:hypothetical protein